MKYRSKLTPTLKVEAHQFDVNDASTHQRVNSGLPTTFCQGEVVMGRFWCGTHDRPREVRDKDWIVVNGLGDVFAVNPDTFGASYEEYVEPAPASAPAPAETQPAQP